MERPHVYGSVGDLSILASQDIARSSYAMMALIEG